MSINVQSGGKAGGLFWTLTELKENEHVKCRRNPDYILYGVMRGGLSNKGHGGKTGEIGKWTEW